VKIAGIAELKAHLAHFIRMAKSGNEIEIHDRGVPVALLTKFSNKSRGLIITPPSKKEALFSKFKFRSKIKTEIDAVSILLEDRAKR
jgi:antitoxin (DNA-binding transcriptional repressor) of toxin-antitoxin stability system